MSDTPEGRGPSEEERRRKARLEHARLHLARWGKQGKWRFLQRGADRLTARNPSDPYLGRKS